MKKKFCQAKRILSLILAMVMLFGMVPMVQAAETGTTVYLVPNANWKVDNARFAVYYWNNSGNGWTNAVNNGEGYYAAEIPSGYTNLIFCRMNPNAAANNWNNKWNQTSDLTLTANGKNCYTVKEGTWDKGGGTWSTYTPKPVEKSYYLYGWINGADVTSNTLAFEDGKLTVTFTAADNYVFVKDNSGASYMTNGWQGSGVTSTTLGTSYASGDKLHVPAGEYEFTLVENGDGTLGLSCTCLTPPPTETEYYLVGYINGADYGIAADAANLGDYKFVDGQLVVTFVENCYVMIKDSKGVQYGTNAYCTDASATLVAGGGEKMFVPGNQELTFTLTVNDDGTLTLSYTVPAVEIPDGQTAVTIHYYKAEGWGNINAYTWNGHDNGAWPGSPITANATHAGWFDLVVPQETPASFNFIFNDGSNQTADLHTGDVTGNTELWVVGNTVMTIAPGEWTGVYTYTLNIYSNVPSGWSSSLNAYVWDANETTLLGGWPGTAMTADSANAGWYHASVSVEGDNSPLNLIINDGNGHQTADLTSGTLNFVTNVWVVNGAVQTTAPSGWVDAGRTIHVPGTFPGPSWDAGSNQMTYDADLGLYTCTFKNVPAANYEFKIAINGSWNENYGANGVREGSNIAVTVPKTMDVIVYYNDNTHNAVTNVTYKFVDVSVSGTGITSTALTDVGLTGIYSGSVYMAAGTYTDVKITCGGVDYAFNKITISSGKNVSFYIDPVTGIYYCDASNTPIKTSAIVFDSQDEAYKAPYGAVAQNEEVRFSIATGDDITSAVLVIKGVASVPMTKGNDGKWTATTSIVNIGEYDYYFALSNGSTVAIYGDDDGYYGKGKVTDLTSVMPYDLVVYEEGFETPDWMKDAVIYQIFPDRFFDGDTTNNQDQTWARGDVDYEYIQNWYTLPENPEQESKLDKDTYLSSGAHYGDGQWSNEIYGGDLKGIIDRIDYLKALGVNVIYLNPVFWSISNHRYDAVDYTQIDPILGTLGDFRELVAVAEANDMHIILDGVFNHVSDDSVYFDRYYKFLGTSEKIGAYPYWAYVYDYMSQNNVSQDNAERAARDYFTDEYNITDYSYTEWFAVSSNTMDTVDTIGQRAGKYVYSYEGWWGYDSMPIIYSTNGSEYQTGNWANEIISGENSVNAYWISQGMDGWRLDVANEVSDETWQNFRDSVKALDSEAVIIGEIWDDATKYLMGDMYDSVMNYLFRNAATGFAMGTNAQNTTKALEKIRERYPEEAFYAMMNLVGSHDTTRLLSYLDGIGDDRSQKDFDSAFPTYEKTSQLAKDRQYLVAFLQFTYAGAPTIYYGDEIGMVGSDDPDDRRAFEWGKGNQKLVEWYASLAAIRAAYPALRTGSVEPMDLGSSNLMGYVRADAENSIIVIANNSTSAKTVSLDGAYVDLVTGKAFTGSVPAMKGVILVAEDEVKTITVNTEDLAPAYDSSYIVKDEGRDHTAHNHQSEVITPTCTEQGSTVWTCACGDSYTTDVVEATGHNYKNGTCVGCGLVGPAIAQQPVNTTVYLNEFAEVTVEAEGTGLTYQWYYKDTTHNRYYRSTITEPTYRLKMTGDRNGRLLYCVITDAKGRQVTSDVVTLTASPREELEIVSQPETVTGILNQFVSVELNVKGDGLTYQWFYKDTNLGRFYTSTITDPAYKVKMLPERDGRQVYCIITDGLGNQVKSGITTLKAKNSVALNIVTQPTDVEGALNSFATVSMKVEGDDLTYQWFYKDTNHSTFYKSTITDAEYRVKLLPERNGRQVYCEITDALGNMVRTETVTMTARCTTPLEIISQPTDVEGDLNSFVTVSMKVEGDGLTYQWYFKDPNHSTFYKSTITDAEYRIKMLSERDGRQVYCVITDALGHQVTTETVTIHIN